MRRLSFCLACLTLALLLPACGGSTTAEPKSAASEGDGEASTAADDDEETAAEENGAAEQKPTAPSCDDGTCSLCGGGICPSGWYCDQNASGGPACGWLKECADKPSCACVTRVLGASCKCREQQGGLDVSCN